MEKSLNNNSNTHELDTLTTFGSLVVGNAGAVGTVKGSNIASIERLDVGKYKIHFKEVFNRALNSQYDIMYGSISAVSKIQVLETPATFQANLKSTKALTIQCVGFDGEAVEAEAGSVISMRAVSRVTSTGPWD